MNQSPSQALEEKGWLTLNQFVQYLKDEHPIKSLSYPAILRYVEKGILEATKVGGQRRITKECIEHYLEYGVEIPFGADPSTYKNEAQMPSSNSNSESSKVKTLEGYIPDSLIIPAIPESRVKRPRVPFPPADD